MIQLEQLYIIIKSLERYLAKGSINQSNILTLKPQLEYLFKLMPKPKFPMMPSQLERLTVNLNVPPYSNNKISKIEYLKYPQKEYVKKHGRCNMPGHSVFYGGFNLLTSVSELKPDIGVHFTHSEWKLKELKPIQVFPIFFPEIDSNDAFNELSQEIRVLHHNYVSSMAESDRKALNMVMNFLASCFAKDVDENNDLDYYLSAVLAFQILNSKDFGYDAILYPSVKMRSGFSNLAIRPDVFDEMFELVEVRYQCNWIPPGGNGFNYVISRANLYNEADGIISWEDCEYGYP